MRRSDNVSVAQSTAIEDVLRVDASVRSADGRVLVVHENLATISHAVSDLAGLNEAIAVGPSRIAYWLMLETYANLEVQGAQDALDALEVERIASEAGDKKRGTVTAMKAGVKATPEWVRLHAALRRAEAQAAVIKVGRKTAEECKDANRELAQNLRAELQALLGGDGVRGGRDLVAAAEAAMERMVQKMREKRGQ